MKKIQFVSIFIICSIIFLVSCRTQNEDTNTLRFASFLQNTFGTKISNGLNYYLLVPDNQCPNCIHFQNEKKRQDIVVVTSLPEEKFTNNFKKVLFDKDAKLMKLPFLDYSNQLVCTDNGKIVAIVPASDINQQIDSLEQIYH